MKVLVTGGAGYIGSHTSIELLATGHDVLIIDNLENGKYKAIHQIEHLAGKPVKFEKCDIRDRERLNQIFVDFRPDGVIHFAGLKSLSQSLTEPEMYYDVNVGGTASLLGAMEKSKTANIVFSSSATVYGEPLYLPCDETHPLKPTNPYGYTKMVCEALLQSWAKANEHRKVVTLRYFNPVGGHPSGSLGEDPKGVPNNLMPLIADAAVGKLLTLKIFGNNYKTHDGTGVRDFIHVCDLADAHVAALKFIQKGKEFEAFNVGRGIGVSVLELVGAFERVARLKLSYEFQPRREGDAPEVWADVTKAKDQLNFTAKRDILDMCRDTWNWKTTHPNGFDS